MVESAAVRDISEASVYTGASFLLRFCDLDISRLGVQNISFRNSTLKSHTAYRAPSTHTVGSIFVCVAWFSHILAVVRVRSREGRRNRAPPPRIRWKDGKKVNPAVAAAEEAKAAVARGA